MKKWIKTKLCEWFGWNLTGRPVLFASETAVGTLPSHWRHVVPIIFKRAAEKPNMNYRTPEHGEQTGAYCDRDGTYLIHWDGIRKREVFLCTSYKRVYDVVPKGGCECKS